MKKKYESLIEGSISKSLILFAVPIMVTNLFQQFYNSVDTAVIGSFAGNNSLAAVGSSATLMNLLVGFFLGIATGTGILIANYYGAGNYKKLKKVAQTAILLSFCAGIVIMILGIIFVYKILVFMNCPYEVILLAASYLKIILIGVPANLVYNVGAGIVRACGDSKRPLYYLFLSGMLNAVLDFLFVAYFKMDVEGAALATTIAQYFSAVLIIINIRNSAMPYKIKLKNMSLSKEEAIDITKISVPCGLQTAMFNISNILVQISINGFGAIVMAGYAAYERIDLFLYVPMQAFSLAISTFVGQNIGAGKQSRIKKGIRIALIITLFVTILLSLIVIYFRNSLLGLFTSSSEIKEAGIKCMFILAPFTWTLLFSEILAGAIRGTGKTVQTMIITACSVCVFRIIWLSILNPMFNDVRIVYLCYPVSWTLASICITIYYLIIKDKNVQTKKLKKGKLKVSI
ncbi:MATE family efflux transporter [Clostridium sp. BJN0001]|uniref:MATE family efflux transporter n=1 Tax=Clostridium sp. BJN0001 TaxID=2930219 RepID=UPI001FD51735|nr:MATE family efflux transporter [Clostridium sp. BJN0001]